MKKIFEDYGRVIVVSIAIVALIAIVGIIVGGNNGGLIGEALVSVARGFSDFMDEKVGVAVSDVFK